MTKNTMKTMLTLVAGVMFAGAVNAADGWRTNGGGNWNTPSYWKDGTVAGGTATDTAYLYYQDAAPSITLTEDVILHAIRATGRRIDGGSFTRSGSTAAFQMKNNPVIDFMPAYYIQNRTRFKDDGIIQGDGTVLTLKGGEFALEDAKSGTYSINGFSRVDVRDQPSFTIYGVGGVASGDVRLVNSLLNLDYNGLSTTNNLIGGKLIVGPGASYLRMGNTGANKLPATIERERAGLLNVYDRPNNHAFSMDNPAQHLNHEGRFPTWCFYGLKYDFLTFNEMYGFTNANLKAVRTFADATKMDTVITTQATALTDNAAAAAVLVTNALDLAEHTLTLGNEKEPGLLVMRTDVSGENGAVTFDGPEGIIVAREGNRTLKAKLTGTNSVTVTAGYFGLNNTAFCLHLANPHNTFSGGLDLLAGSLSVTDAGSLGTGPVKVHGYPSHYDHGVNNLISGGGTLFLKGCTVTNDLSLSGMGIAGVPTLNARSNDSAPVNTASACSLFLCYDASKSAGVKGAITLEDTTAIRTVSNVGRPFVLAGPVSGDHTLHLWPGWNSVMKFSNTVATDAVAITSPTNGAGLSPMGTVAFGSAAALDTAALRNDSTVIFEGSGTFTGALTGEGSYKQTDNVDVVFAQNVDQKGGLLVEKGSVTLGGSANTLGAVSGAGTINVAETSTLRLGSNETCFDGYFKGDLQTSNGARLTLVKAGTNTQVFAGTMSFDGAVVVEAGTLKLGRLHGRLPKTTSAAQVHVDAMDAASVVTNGDATVETWLNKGAVQANFVQGEDSLKPVYNGAAMDGRGGIEFDASDTVKSVSDPDTLTKNRLYLADGSGNGVKSKIGRLYMAFSVYKQTHFGGPIGNYNDDAGVRFDYSNQPADKGFQIERALTRASSHTFVLNDEVKTVVSGGSCNKVYVLGQDVGEQLDWCLTLGHYYTFASKGENVPRAFKGAIGEVLTYPTALNPVEEYTVRAYLNEKWGVVEGPAATENVLPAGSTLTIQVGGVVDFGGVSQRLAKLENYGTIRNSSATPVVITVTDAVLAGKIEGNVKIVVDGGTALLKSWRNLNELPVRDDLVFHLDAANLLSLLRNEAGQVTNWVDRSGNGNNFVEDRNPYANAVTLPPMFDATCNNGRGAVVFATPGKVSAEANRLSSLGKTCALKSVFFLTLTDTKGTGGKFQFCGVFGPRNTDQGIRLNDATSFNNHGGSVFTDDQNWYVNGTNSRTFTPGENYVLEVGVDAEALTKNQYTQFWSLGQYYYENSNSYQQLRGYNGTVSEVIAYDRYVTAEERAAINAYLRSKWIDGPVIEHALSDNVSVGLVSGATLDLGASAQTIHGLSGAGGAIVNGVATISGVLEVVADAEGNVTPHRFNGATLADGLKIVLKGTPNASRVVVATGIAQANASTFVAPSSSWTVSVANGELSLAKGGTLLILR